jgi:hypothetical protein
VSEYQYYEFRSIDRPLTEDERRMLRSLSGRAEITATSFVNTYNWGDFKGEPDRLMEEVFDAFIYVANWGTRHFSLRLPKKLADLKLLREYGDGDLSGVRVKGDFAVIDFVTDEVGLDWEAEGEGWMASLLPLRDELLRGDPRCMYLGWLRSAQCGVVDEGELEPPVPAGLGALSGPLESFREFFEIDSDLIDIAAEASRAEQSDTNVKAMEQWVRGLPEAAKTELLLTAAAGRIGNVGAELQRRFRKQSQAHGGTQPEFKRRTVRELLAAAKVRETVRARIEAEAAEATRRRTEAEQAQARERYLDALAAREEEAWDNVGALIGTKRPRDYDEAVRLMTDLHDLAKRRNLEGDFALALRVIREEHAKKPSFLKRLADAGW